MAATLLSMVNTATRCDTPESTLSHTLASSNAQSSSSTPPTSVADSTSVASPRSKRDGPLLSIFDAHIDDEEYPIDEDRDEDDEQEDGSGRPRRARKITVKAADWAESVTSSAKKARSERGGSVTRRRTVSGETLVSSHEDDGDFAEETNGDETREVVEDGIELQLPARKLQKSRSAMSLGGESSLGKKSRFMKDEAARRKSARFTNEPTESLATKLSVLGKRGRDAIDEASFKIKRELRRLADTNEFAKIETKPVVHEVWSCGKLVTGNEPPKKKKEKKAEEAVVVNQVWSRGKLLTEVQPKKKAEEPIIIHEVWSCGKLVTGNEPPKKKAKVEKVKEPEPEPIEEEPEVKKVKKWLNRGLYAGQEAIVDLSHSYTAKERKAMAKANAEVKRRSILPLPLWAGQRLLLNGRDFKLPFDVCSPLPPGQPKPDEWRKTTKNRFIGDAAALWKKTKHFSDSDSRCICSPSTGCGEDCYNRMMLYECDNGNCPLGAELCGNRAFADLHERRAKGGKYRVGVEVIKTEDRGYGVRANRCFQEGQIIVEYTGEIITEPECQRRMREDYKNNECYYLMLFDQNMIIDATRGSIARFVNHSCEPNCEMVKWIVGGKPHMALFAGKNPIMTGEELTYDYKFDPFSSRNVQECRCGAESCRGVLGPRPKEVKKVETVKGVKGVVKGMKGVMKKGKRKLKELMGGDAEGVEKVAKKRKILVPVGKSKVIPTKSAKAKAMAKAKKVAKKMGKVGAAATATTAKKSPKAAAKSPKPAKSPKGLKQAKLSFGNQQLTVVVDESASPSPKKAKKETSVKAVKPRKSGMVVVKRRGTKVVMKKGVRGEGKKTIAKKAAAAAAAAAAETAALMEAAAAAQ
ncbi:hypothetical protein V501_07656 [Pseudogymnoascus sp. VKM F-4519 (FW-2642)]|nr:hypothetical protein V501_07656 [Pseudogymnoascus sp. VKM F-4519 (FW-2642)]